VESAFAAAETLVPRQADFETAYVSPMRLFSLYYRFRRMNARESTRSVCENRLCNMHKNLTGYFG